MLHRRFLGFSLAVVGLGVAALGVVVATEAAPPVASPVPSASPEVVIVATDEQPPTAACDVDPHFSRRWPSGATDPGFSGTVAPTGTGKDIDPGFFVRIPCPLDTAPRRAPEASPPAT